MEIKGMKIAGLVGNSTTALVEISAGVEVSTGAEEMAAHPGGVILEDRIKDGHLATGPAMQILAIRDLGKVQKGFKTRETFRNAVDGRVAEVEKAQSLGNRKRCKRTHQ